LSGAEPQIIEQEDTFFRCKDARLKLRIFGPNRGELIRYKRQDQPGPRVSNYTIARTDDPHALLAILTETLGQTGRVFKTRTLYLVGQTRVHLDQVEGLGEFMELEVVLRPGQSQVEGEVIAHELLKQFEIPATDLIAKPYVDLLQESPIATAKRGHYNLAEGIET
jgi:predicted adenylyl cyclase CyaB